MRRDQR